MDKSNAVSASTFKLYLSLSKDDGCCSALAGGRSTVRRYPRFHRMNRHR